VRECFNKQSRKKQRKKMSEVQMSKIMSVPKWDGKGKTFQGWWMQFVTFAALINFEALIEDEIHLELLSSGMAPLGNDKQGKIKNWANDSAMVAENANRDGYRGRKESVGTRS